MTSVPYPSFRPSEVPVDAKANRAALVAVGRCRIHPLHSVSEKYRSIVAKTVDQAHVDLEDDAVLNAEAKKKLKKRYMKEGVALAQEFLMEKLGLDVSIIDVEVYVDSQDLVASDGCLASCLLDAGCQMIVTDGTELEALDAAKIPKERLIGHFTYSSTGLFEAIDKAKEFCSGVSIRLEKCEDISVGTMMSIIESAPDMEVVIQFRPSDSEEFQENIHALSRLVTDVCKAFKGRGTISLIDPTARELGYCYAACMKTDRDDGLYTTVVCTRNGEALGLVYSSKDSIVAALECGRGVYYSRSRKSLWRKGDTSGHFQTLHRLDVDCDGDALRFTVTQRGEGDAAAFCHLNTLTCWGHPRGLRHLEETLQDRLVSAPEGSYTKRLFDDSALLRDKLVEEAQELSEATGAQHVAEELADVLYFAMVRATKAGVSIDDAVAELDRRARKVTRRRGDSKAFRIAAGQSILEKKKGCDP